MDKDKLIVDLEKKNNDLREDIKKCAKRWKILETVLKMGILDDVNTYEEKAVFTYIYHLMKDLATKIIL